MNREELERLIAEVQHRQSELHDVEVKSARAGTPKRLYEALSAFANRTGGGVILFGLNESADFGVIGVGNAHQLQADIGDLASSEIEPALRLNQVDALTAGRELRGLVQAELVGQESARRWTYYTLGVPRELPGSVPALSDEERILSFARDRGSIGNAECQALLGIDGKRAWYLLKKLAKSGLLAPAGEGKGRRYRPA